ncbi:MAG: serine hydrolase [Myxococcales bacterium]|nr:serine hydrolase [Myxococcales bacterium]
MNHHGKTLPTLMCLVATAAALAPACNDKANAPTAVTHAPAPPTPRAQPATSPAPAPTAIDVRALAEQESRALATAAGHIWNNIVIYDVATQQVVASVGMVGGTLGAADARYRPGSVMKVFTVAAALAQGKLAANDRFDGKRGTLRLGGVVLKDGMAHQPMSPSEVLGFSSNVGAAQIAQRLDKAQAAAMWSRLGFMRELPNISAMSVGEFARFAAGSAPDGVVDAVSVAKAFAAVLHQRDGLLSNAQATLLRQWLRAPTEQDGGTGRLAAVPGMTVIGKTGTARGTTPGAAMGHFVGAFPADKAKYIIVVAVETTADGYAGGEIAAPAFARLAARLR